MFKRIFTGLMAAAMLITTSCQKQEFAPGQDATVTFEVATPEIATRAYSDGQTADNLQYAVYDANGTLLPQLTVTDATINKSANVQLQLTTGNTYSIVFWAAAPNAPYTLDFANKTVTVDYTSAKSNDENRDAFYSYHTFTVSAKTEKVQLQRPFAQLNIGTADYEASTNAGYTPTKSSVTVRDIYTTLNFDGTIDRQSAVEANFAYAAIKKDETFPVAGYEYLAMNYLLVDSDKETIEVKFNFTDGSNEKTRTVGGVPVQRNYRTNIYGNLLTSEVDINVEIAPAYDDNHVVSEFVTSKADIKQMLEAALANGEKNIVINALNANIGDLNYAFTQTLVPAGVTVTLCNATVEGKSYGNGVNGEIIFENCIFTHTGAYSIHFDNGNGKVTFKNCVLYGWNSFGSTLNSVSFYDSKLYGNGTYALIRSYVNLYLENCYINTKEADHTDAYSEGVEAISPATKTEKDCVYATYVDEVAADMQDGGTVQLQQDLAVSANSNIHTQNLTEDLTIDGNGKTIISHAESADDFQWEDGRFPAMSTVLSSEDGSKITVNNLSFGGTMSALMLGHYVNSQSNWYNTELNNVNVIGAEVVSFSSNVSPAVCIYGTATLNDCNIYGTTLSALDTDPMWPVYDLALVNYSKTTVNGGHIGSVIFWNQAAMIVNSGAVIDRLVVLGNMNNNNANNYININAGSEVKVIDLSNITDKNRVKINIEAGATVGKFVANGVEYATLDDYKNA